MTPGVVLIVIRHISEGVFGIREPTRPEQPMKLNLKINGTLQQIDIVPMTRGTALTIINDRRCVPVAF